MADDRDPYNAPPPVPLWQQMGADRDEVLFFDDPEQPPPAETEDS